MTRSDSPAGKTDGDLAACACQGDRQAFGELILRHQDSLVRFVARMVGDASLAEDAAQEAFLRAWQRLHTFDRRRSFRNWIFSIAAHHTLDLLRWEPPATEVDPGTLAEDVPGPESQVESRERRRMVRQAVLALPPAARAVLVLREYEGLSYGEIASALGIPLGTVMSRLNYARNQLRISLIHYMEKP